MLHRNSIGSSCIASIIISQSSSSLNNQSNSSILFVQYSHSREKSILSLSTNHFIHQKSLLTIYALYILLIVFQSFSVRGCSISHQVISGLKLYSLNRSNIFILNSYYILKQHYNLSLSIIK